MKYYLIRFWLALSISFYLFTPYLSRYINGNNRFVFHWNRWDLSSLLLCIMLLGFFFFLCFIIVAIRGNSLTKRLLGFSFIAVFGIAVVANLIQAIKYNISLSPESPRMFWYFRLYSIYVLWALLGILLINAIFKHTNRIKALCVTLCFIVSPIIPIFFFNALRYPSIIPNVGSLPAHLKSNNSKEAMENVYIFILDEWSYQRSFKKQKLIATFKNLKKFEASAFVFHEAFSPAPTTLNSIPALLFQKKLPFTVRGGKIGFMGENFYPINQGENIFHQCKELGFYTCIIGSYMPYGEIVGDSVDFSKAISMDKVLGDGFFEVTIYHLLTAGLLVPEPFFHDERKKITEYFANRLQIDQINSTHELFKTIVQNQSGPTFAVFHYMIPHCPFIFNGDGPKKLYDIYEWTPSNYLDNLAYLDKKIGEIIADLKDSDKFDNSLIVITSDHSWRHDPAYGKDVSTLEKCHIPLFIKFPYQDQSITINSRFSTIKLGSIINGYLDGDFDSAELKSLLNDTNYFTPPLEK